MACGNNSQDLICCYGLCLDLSKEKGAYPWKHSDTLVLHKMAFYGLGGCCPLRMHLRVIPTELQKPDFQVNINKIALHVFVHITDWRQPVLEYVIQDM